VKSKLAGTTFPEITGNGVLSSLQANLNTRSLVYLFFHFHSILLERISGDFMNK
jgi:hypothetical protein